MNKNYKILFLIAYLALQSPEMTAQHTSDLVAQVLQNKNLDLTKTEWQITSEHTSTTSGTTHVYFRQQLNGIPIKGTSSSIHIDKTGSVLEKHIRFVDDLASKVLSPSGSILTPIDAVTLAAGQMGYENPTSIRVKSDKNSKDRSMVLSAPTLSQRDIPISLVYEFIHNQQYMLSWEMSILEFDFEHWWDLTMDASTGELLGADDRIQKCRLDSGTSEVEIPLFHRNLFDIPNFKPREKTAASLCENCYEVFALPVESPFYGERSIVEFPWHPVASPYGWHDTDGIEGPESRYTEGNNVWAREVGDNSGYMPFGGDQLDFTGFPFDTFFSNNSQYEDSAITNIFYWSNIIHDVYYVYGFTEAAGNYQENNYLRGGVEGDKVNVQGQRNISGCNAYFGGGIDGESAILIYGTCGNKDGSYDSILIAHEYGHGIVQRLIGGPLELDCFNNNEQMTEGWADWFGAVLTIEPGDVGTDRRPIGNYYFDKGINSNGIRRYPYSTDMSINSHTYFSIAHERVPHGVGSVWANMLWEMTWQLIEDHGFDPDVYNFTGDASEDAGNIMAMALVIEALKLTNCHPGFVDGRDAILQADRSIYNGYNQCSIWKAFAKRGLGLRASQGSAYVTTDGFEDFDGTLDRPYFDLAEENYCYENSYITGLRGGLPLGGIYSGPGVIDDGNGVTFSLDLEVAGVGEHELFYELPKSDCLEETINSTTITIALDTVAPEISCPIEGLEVSLPFGLSTPIPDFEQTIQVNDFCSSNFEFHQTPPPDTMVSVGLHLVSIQVIDEAGNESSCEFEYRVLRLITPDESGNRDLNALELISIAPNPAEGTVLLDNPLKIRIKSVEIRDVIGRLVDLVVISNSNATYELDVRKLSSGNYFLNVQTDEHSKTFRLVKG